MVDTNRITAGSYLNAENTKDGDIVVITGEGEFAELERNGKVKEVLNLPVETNGLKLIYTPNQLATETLQKMFGSTDSKEWVGKKFKVTHVDYLIGKEKKKGVQPVSIEEKVE